MLIIKMQVPDNETQLIRHNYYAIHKNQDLLTPGIYLINLRVIK
jgi:hypothetical protein